MVSFAWTAFFKKGTRIGMRSWSARFVLAGCFSLLSVSPGLAGKDNKLEHGEAMLARGIAVSDIRAEGSPQFRLSARVRLINVEGQANDGEYEEDWVSPKQWRRTTKLPQYTEMDIRRENRTWHSGTAQYPPYNISLLMSCFGLGSHPGLWPREGTKRSVKRVTADSRMECVGLQDVTKLKGKGILPRTLCYDPASGAMLRAEDDNSGLRTLYIYENYEQFGQKRFPRHIRTFQNGLLVIDVEITELASQPTVDPSLFTAPADAEERFTCDNPKPPRPLDHPDPPYPNKGRGSWTVLVYAVVGIDGKAHNVAAIQPHASEFTASAVETISQRWRFAPPTCGDHPVPSELFIAVDFHSLR